jgi:hypothetical protein
MGRQKLYMVLLVIVLALMTMVAGQQGMTPPLPFYQQVGHPLKFFTISKHSPEDRAAFRDEILTRDTDRILTIDKPLSVAGSDVILVLLQHWSEAADLPLQEDLGQIYKRVAKLDSDTFRHMIGLVLDGGKPVLLVFYNDSAVRNGTRNCYARDFIYSLSNSSDGPPFDFAQCTQTGY